MKTIFILFISAAALSLSMGAVAGGDAAAGKVKSANCAGCHGMNGKSTNPNNPNLAGQKEAYLIKATKDYRDGKRKDPMMNSMVSGLSDADIANLAAFYSSIK
ncbi:MAG: cytochrome c [Gammaproteobacteria bacterium]